MWGLEKDNDPLKLIKPLDGVTTRLLLLGQETVPEGSGRAVIKTETERRLTTRHLAQGTRRGRVMKGANNSGTWVTDPGVPASVIRASAFPASTRSLIG